MKKIIATLLIGISTLTISIASNTKTLTNEIKEKVTIDGNRIYESNQSYLTVSFKIINNKVKIEKIVGSNNHEFNKHIISKLTHLTIESSYKQDKKYTCKFILK